MASKQNFLVWSGSPGRMSSLQPKVKSCSCDHVRSEPSFTQMSSLSSVPVAPCLLSTQRLAATFRICKTKQQHFTLNWATELSFQCQGVRSLALKDLRLTISYVKLVRITFYRIESHVMEWTTLFRSTFRRSKVWNILLNKWKAGLRQKNTSMQKTKRKRVWEVQILSDCFLHPITAREINSIRKNWFLYESFPGTGAINMH